MQQRPNEIDPDFFDVLIQSISVLSNIATMAGTWIAIRQQRSTDATPAHTNDQIRAQLRILRRGLEDTFDAVEDTLRILEGARLRANGVPLQADKTRFGRGVLLNLEELNKVNQSLQQLDLAALNTRSAARAIQSLMLNSNLAATHNVHFDPEQLNEALNSILFESRDIGDALTKLRLAQQSAEDFVSEIDKALRRN